MKIQRLVRQAASRALLSRTYATETATGTKKGLVVNFTLPHVTLLKNLQATQVNLSSTDGDMGILADHVPAIAQLKPGVIDILSAEGGSASSKKFFVSGGFAVMNPDSSLNINAVEAVPLEDLDLEAARKAADEANRVLGSSASEEDKLDAKMALEVYSAAVATVSK